MRALWAKNNGDTASTTEVKNNTWKIWRKNTNLYYWKHMNVCDY